MNVIFNIGFIIALVLLNGYFVASEFALVAIRRTRVDEMAKQGVRGARQLQTALDNLNDFLSATQLGITLSSLALGWIGEPSLARFLEPLFSFLPSEAATITAHAVSVGVAFFIITFLHIVLGEIAPKSLALQRMERTSLIVIGPLLLFARVFHPFIWFLNQSGQLVLKAFGLHAPTGHKLVHSEEEIRMILKQSTQGGAIEAGEAEMVNNVFLLGDIPVEYVMVPRTDIVAFSVTTPVAEIVRKIEHHPHSRFPIYEKTIDNIVGFIHVKDVYREVLKNKGDLKLSELSVMRESINVPELMKIDDVLALMRRKRTHLAVVNDEFGGTAGIVTLEDVIESLVGEIEDEFDQPVRDITKQKDGSYLVEGHTTINEIKEQFHLPLKGLGYTTIGGLVFGLLGHKPSVGDTVEVSHLSFTVEELKGKRISRIRVRKLPK